MKRDLLFLLKSSCEMQHYLLQLMHIHTYIIQNALLRDCLLCLWGAARHELETDIHLLGVVLNGTGRTFSLNSKDNIQTRETKNLVNKWIREWKWLPSLFSPSLCLSLSLLIRPFTPFSLLCFPLPLHLEGSQRISDSEISDYDCEDGVGVITGNILRSY